MIALPPSGAARIAGGDTLVIHSGQYQIGLGAPGAESCSSAYPWDCAMAPVPSGPDASRPTRIVGQGYDAGCPAAPQLWGNERTSQVLSLARTNNAQVSCLEITDHSPCVEFHSGALTCKRDTYPYGAWSSTGIYAADSTNVQLTDVNVHGLAIAGVHAGRLKDWTVTNLRVAGNGWVGWNGDLGATTSSNTGTMRFSRWLVEWNGCGETYPGNQPTGCWGQEAGGYGDGVGTAATAGDWIIEDSTFRFNTSDGLDLLYHNLGGTITLNRVRAEGNAGNQLKVAGTASVTNSIILGNCGYFNGKSFNYFVDHCRALGDAVAISANTATDTLSFVNNTLVSEGNVAIFTGGPSGTSLKMRNNIIIGLPYFHYPSLQSADAYHESAGFTIDESHSVKQSLRNMNCSSPSSMCTSAAIINGSSNSALDPNVPVGSAARDSGLGVGGLVPNIDFYGKPRPAGNGVDRGAVEMQ